MKIHDVARAVIAGEVDVAEPSPPTRDGASPSAGSSAAPAR